MCDERTELENTEYLKKKAKVTRRKFNKMSAGAGLAMMLPPVANAQGRGFIKCGSHHTLWHSGLFLRAPCFWLSMPAVLVWPDIFGLRPGL